MDEKPAPRERGRVLPALPREETGDGYQRQEKSMTREIKFRAWDVQGRRMVYSFNMTSDGDVAFQYDEFLDGDAFILMQFTGLKDKNGKEIFEGDIVVYRGVSTVAVMFMGAFNLNEVRHDHLFRSLPSIWEMGDKGEVEAVGNIHENGDLLKDEWKT